MGHCKHKKILPEILLDTLKSLIGHLIQRAVERLNNM